jgi:hypothetical protein
MTLPSVASGADPGTVTGPTAPRDGYLAGRRRARSDKQLAGWVQEQFAKARNDRQKFERQWYLNLQMYRGNQNVEFRRMPTSTAGYKLAVPPAPAWRARPVINRIRPIARKEMSKLTAQKPTWIVVPATMDDQDHSAARAAEQVLDGLYSDLQMGATQRLAVWWAVICGNGFFKDYWDRTAGRLVKDERTGGQVSEGMSCVEAVDPFHLFVPDLRESKIDNQPWVIHASTRSPQYVKTYYGLDVPGGLVRATELFTDDLILGTGAPQPSDQVLILEAWLRPGGHKDFPAGGLITVVGDQVYQTIDVAKTGPVYQHGELPFTKIDLVESGGFYADSVITDLNPLQRMYNRQRGQMIENANVMGKNKWLAPQGSIKGANIDSEPGQIIFYQLVGPPPTPVPAAPLPEYVQAQPGLALQDMDDISGQHEISRGQAPGQVTAATAISYLQEQDDTMIAWAIASLEDGMARLGRHLLSHVSQFWGAPRAIKVVGDDLSFDVVTFGASQLAGNTDVRVEAGSALPASRSAKQATALELFKLGAFGPPGSPEASQKLLEILDMSGIDKALEEWRVDQRQAQRENIRMAAGQPLEIHNFDNHQRHTIVHNRFRKGQKFESLDPQIQAIFEQHVMMHEQANMQQQMVAAQAGMGPAGPSDQSGDQGASGGPPGSPGDTLPPDAGGGGGPPGAADAGQGG